MMGNSILLNTAGSIALAIDYTVKGPYRDKFLTKIGARQLRLHAEFFVAVGAAVLIFDTNTDPAEADLDAGANFAPSTTYYLYACHPLSGQAPVLKISSNATYPAGGWDGDTSRQIGGFDTDGDGNILEATLWDLRTVDITISGVTDAMIPAREISAGKVQFDTYFQRGFAVFAGSTGVTVPIVDVGTIDYEVSVLPSAQGAYVGQISVGPKAANSFVVKNSGSDVSTQFDWTLDVGY